MLHISVLFLDNAYLNVIQQETVKNKLLVKVYFYQQGVQSEKWKPLRPS